MIKVTFFNDPSVDNVVLRNSLRTVRICGATFWHEAQIVRLNLVLLGPIADDEYLCRTQSDGRHGLKFVLTWQNIIRNRDRELVRPCRLYQNLGMTELKRLDISKIRA